jgi:hypothetical protein
MIFNFFQIGESPYPDLLIKSIRSFIPNAYIIHSTDLISKSYYGVDRIFRYDGDSSKLMSFRLESNLAINLTEKTIFLDSDMLIVKNFSLNQWLENDVILCSREFNSDNYIKTSFRGLNLIQYKNKTFGEIWPFLGCLNIVHGPNFWNECTKKLENMDSQLLAWYSDQEAIRDVFNEKQEKFSFAFAKESLFACLPEFVSKSLSPSIIHFKGPSRKEAMIKMANELFR